MRSLVQFGIEGIIWLYNTTTSISYYLVSTLVGALLLWNIDLHNMDIMEEEFVDDHNQDTLLATIIGDSSNEDDTPLPVRRGVSQRGRRGNINRHWQVYAQFLFDDYWGDTLIYPLQNFRNTFWMPQPLFDEILEAITNHDDYFVQRRDACGAFGFYTFVEGDIYFANVDI